jgi:hypothetical protein
MNGSLTGAIMAENNPGIKDRASHRDDIDIRCKPTFKAVTVFGMAFLSLCILAVGLLAAALLGIAIFTGNTEPLAIVAFMIPLLAVAIILLLFYRNIVVGMEARGDGITLLTAVGRVRAASSQIHGRQGRRMLWLVVNREHGKTKMLWLIEPFFSRIDWGSIKLRITMEK